MIFVHIVNLLIYSYAISNATICGGRTAQSNANGVINYYYGIYCSSGQLTFIDKQSVTKYTVKTTLSAARTKLFIDIPSKLVTVNGSSYSVNITGTNAYLDINYFACDYYGSGIRDTTSHAQVPGTLYEAQAWDSTGDLISHMIPAREASTGKLGMYDIVNNFFNAASSDSSTVSGPAV